MWDRFDKYCTVAPYSTCHPEQTRAYGCVEIFACQIFDLACAKIPSWMGEGGIAVHSTTYTRRCYFFGKTILCPWKGCTNSGYTPSDLSSLGFVPLGAKHLDCTKFRRVRFADLLKVTIASITNTKSILMVTRYAICR